MKRTRKIISLLVALVILSGCFYDREVYKVGKTGKVTLTETMMISPKYFNEQLKKLSDAQKANPPADDDMKIDYSEWKLDKKSAYKEVKNSFKQTYSHSKKKMKFKKVSKKINGYTYYGYKVTGVVKKDIHLKTTYKHGIIKAVYTIDLQDNVTDISDTYPMPADAINYKVTIKCPYKPKTTYGKVKNKTVTFDVMKAAKKYEKKKNPKITITIVTKKHKHSYKKTKTGKKCKYCGKFVKKTS